MVLVGIVAGSTISARLDICTSNLHDKINVFTKNLDLMFWPLNKLMHQKKKEPQTPSFNCNKLVPLKKDGTEGRIASPSESEVNAALSESH